MINCKLFLGAKNYGKEKLSEGVCSNYQIDIKTFKILA